MVTQSKEIAYAGQIDLPGGRRIWIPPTGRPYWVGGVNAGPCLTDEEIIKYLPKRSYRTFSDSFSKEELKRLK